MSQANQDRKVKELLSSVKVPFKEIKAKEAYIKKNTGWNDDKVARVLKRVEMEDAN